MDYLKDLVKKINFPLMIIALAISFVLWIVCMNFEDPQSYDTIQLSLSLLNEDTLTNNRKLIENKREIDGMTVKVTVTGLSSELEKLARNDTIYAFIDLDASRLINSNEIGSGIPTEIRVGFTGVSPENYSITDISPHTVNIILDNYVEKTMAVDVKLTGSVPSGYVAMLTEQDVTDVIISGPSSVISKITSLMVEVDLTDERADIVDELEIKAYNTFGEEVAGAGFSVGTVNVKIPILKTGWVSISEPECSGSPAAGYVVSGVIPSRKSVRIMGPAGDVEAVWEIILDPIAVDGISQDIEVSYDISLYLQRLNEEFGYSLRLAQDTESEVTVSIKVERIITKNLEIQVDKDISFAGLGFQPNRKITPLTEYVNVTISGVPSVINATETLTGRVNVYELPDGDHEIFVDFDVPDGVEIVGTPNPVLVNISTQPASETQTPGVSSGDVAGSAEGGGNPPESTEEPGGQ